jgi:hypothetical protein
MVVRRNSHVAWVIVNPRRQLRCDTGHSPLGRPRRPRLPGLARRAGRTSHPGHAVGTATDRPCLTADIQLTVVDRPEQLATFPAAPWPGVAHRSSEMQRAHHGTRPGGLTDPPVIPSATGQFSIAPLRRFRESTGRDPTRCVPSADRRAASGRGCAQTSGRSGPCALRLIRRAPAEGAPQGPAGRWRDACEGRKGLACAHQTHDFPIP